jgi:hypothetical protein
MRSLALLCLAPLVAACSSSPESPYAAARAQGYTASEELRERIAELTQLEPGVWAVGFQRSARSYRILSAVSADAAALAARAEAARQSGAEVVATILVHETAPGTKSPEALRAAEDEGPYPWILVRLDESSDPAPSASSGAAR